jgi:nanoRNase/pAp phosphatase (c-di-AMP/oligoRNAs hydrolase)
MKNKIYSAKNILIVPEPSVDIDILASIFALGKTLKDYDKEVRIFLQKELPPFLFSIIHPENLKFWDKEKPESYIISLKDQKAQVKEVNWEQKDDTIEIIISTDTGTLSSNYDIRAQRKFVPELIIFLGNEQFNLSQYEVLQDISLDKVISFDLRTQKKLKIYSFSELITDFLCENNFDITSKSATNLLSGTLWKTKNLQQGATRATLERLSLLVDFGANLSTSPKNANQNLKPIETRLLIQVLEKIKITKDDIAISKISNKDIFDINIDEVVFPYWDLTRFLPKVSASVIFIEGEKRIKVFVHSNKPSIINALKVSSDFDAKGDEHEATFITNADSKNLEKELLLKIRMFLTGEIERVKLSEKISEDFKKLKKSKAAAQKREKKDRTTTVRQKPAKIKSIIQTTNSDRIDGASYLPAQKQQKVITPKLQDSDKTVEPENNMQRQQDYDPLQPAINIPDPLKLDGEEEPQPTYQGPLPPAED